MTNSNAQLWDNGISAIGTWINSMKTNLGDILHVLTIQNIMSMKDIEIHHIFMIGEQIGHRQMDRHPRWVSYSISS